MPPPDFLPGSLCAGGMHIPAASERVAIPELLYFEADERD